jgi:SOS-response transcriptional repressor LexA
MSSYVLVYEQVIEKLNEAGITNGKIMLLYGKIMSLAQNEDGACCASNGYFAAVLKTDIRNIQKYLKTLKEKGFIKMYEEKSTREYAFTVTRLIYPQWKMIDDELVDVRTLGQDTTNESSGTHEQIGSDPRTNGRNPMNKKVEQGEQKGQKARTNGHPNNREKREMINRLEGADAESREEVAGAPDVVASAPNSADAARLRLPDDLPEDIRNIKFEAKIDDKSMLEVMDRDYREYLDDGWETHEDIRDKLIEKFITGFYCGNKDKVTAYAEFLMEHYKIVPIKKYL